MELPWIGAATSAGLWLVRVVRGSNGKLRKEIETLHGEIKDVRDCVIRVEGKIEVLLNQRMQPAAREDHEDER